MGLGNHVGMCRTMGNNQLVDWSGQTIWTLLDRLAVDGGKYRQTLDSPVLLIVMNYCL